MMIPMTEVPKERSSQVAAYGYEPASKTLAVIFRRGAGHVYHYADVPQEKADGLSTAPSLGIYIDRVIKPSHPFTKLDASVPEDPPAGAAAQQTPHEAAAES